MAYKPRVFKPVLPSGRQTVRHFTKKEAEDIRLLCRLKRDKASDAKEKKPTNPHWSDRYQWDRNLMLIDLGLNTALRIEDLTQLRANVQIKKGYIDIVENKTKRNEPISLNPRITKEIVDYIARNDLKDGEYLFTSRKGFNMPMTRQQAYNLITELAKELGIVRKIGCHSLRKTFGRLYYDDTGDLVGLHKMLHSGKGDIRVTLIYIGVEDDEVAKKRRTFDI